jgi:type I restriction enzyme M protein
MLDTNGTAGVIVPQGVLFGTGKAFVDARKILVDHCELKAVITMPSGVFKPYAGVATAILIFTKAGTTKNVWFYEMKNDGRSLDDKRNELYKPNGDRDYGDLINIIDEFKKKKKNIDRTQQHFIIPKEEIAENDYDLSLSKYKIEVYPEVQYDKPKDILTRLSSIEVGIMKGIEELKEIF